MVQIAMNSFAIILYFLYIMSEKHVLTRILTSKTVKLNKLLIAALNILKINTKLPCIWWDPKGHIYKHKAKNYKFMFFLD